MHSAAETPPTWKAVALAPENTRYLFTPSEHYARAGDAECALTTLTLAVDRDPALRERAQQSEAFAGLPGSVTFSGWWAGSRRQRVRSRAERMRCATVPVAV